MRLLVTGATGFLGAHLVDALLEAGHELRAFARASSRTEALERRGVAVARGSFEEPASIRAALDGVEAIVHAAGGGIARRIDDIYRANTDATRALVEATRGAPSVRRFVLVSSLAAHGPSRPGRPATEDEPDAPRSHYGKSKHAAERAALAHSERLEVVVLRPPALYGPGEHRMVELFAAAARGVVPMVHPGGTLSMLHGADCAAAVRCALDAPGARGIYYVAEPRTYGRREMAERIGQAVGRRVRVVPIPVPLLYGAGVGVELYGALADRAVMLSRDKVRDLSAPHQCCDPSRAMRELDWAPRHDFASGAREALEDYRRRGWM